MSTPPVACTLEPSRLRGRLALIDALVRDALSARDEIPGGLRARFRDLPGVERRVRALAVAESRCCAFLAFAVGRDEGGVWLEVTGDPEARPVIDQLFAPPAV